MIFSRRILTAVTNIKLVLSKDFNSRDGKAWEIVICAYDRYRFINTSYKEMRVRHLQFKVKAVPNLWGVSEAIDLDNLRKIARSKNGAPVTEENTAGNAASVLTKSVHTVKAAILQQRKSVHITKIN